MATSFLSPLCILKLLQLTFCLRLCIPTVPCSDPALSLPARHCHHGYPKVLPAEMLSASTSFLCTQLSLVASSFLCRLAHGDSDHSDQPWTDRDPFYHSLRVHFPCMAGCSSGVKKDSRVFGCRCIPFRKYTGCIGAAPREISAVNRVRVQIFGCHSAVKVLALRLNSFRIEGCFSAV